DESKPAQDIGRFVVRLWAGGKRTNPSWTNAAGREHGKRPMMEFQRLLVLIETGRILGRHRLSGESVFESRSELGQPFLPGAFIKGGQNRGRWLIHRVRREQPQAHVDFRLTH